MGVMIRDRGLPTKTVQEMYDSETLEENPKLYC